MLRDLFSLFPAYAGVIPLPELLLALPVSFPRIRGGDPRQSAYCVIDCNFSPHTRG